MNDRPPSLPDSFARGDYHRVAAEGDMQDWRTHAALGLCGNIPPALARLEGLGGDSVRFYEGAIRWIDGDETAAIRLLERCDCEHADNLLRLIRKNRIFVLAQLPWRRSVSGPHTLLQAGQIDPKFEIRNISFAEDDLQNAPNADIHEFYDAAAPPDFYLAEMVEWHLIPPNLQELPCPSIGQTGDYDLHIQTLYPWLRLFDEIVVTDSTEYADVARLVGAPVTTFCKPVSLPLHLPPHIDVARDLDFVMTGTVLNSYFPDKAEAMRQILNIPDFDPYFLSGFLGFNLYYPMLARCKLALALTRHLGAIPSRGYEALAMGTVLLVPRESCMRLFANENEGVVPFSLENDGLSAAIESVRGDYARHSEAALHGRQIVRDAFDPFRVSSQYLRMATFLAARPRGPRKTEPRPQQKRSVAFRGWLQANERQTQMALRNAILERWKAIAPAQQTLETYCDPARELLLEYERNTLLPSEDAHSPLVEMALNIYRSALPLFPDSLVLRFNFARAAFHFGTQEHVAEALTVTRETLARDPASFALEARDDVMTWDYCQNFFNYRNYLQIVTETLRDGIDRTDDLKRLILASLNHYCGRMGDNPAQHEKAATLDPNFSLYRLWHGKALAQDGRTADAIQVLSSVVPEILYAPESWGLIEALKQEHGMSVPNEENLRVLVQNLEARTLIDEMYAAIRTGPYFRKQRLKLALNGGVEHRKRRSDDAPVRISVLLSDANGSRYSTLLGTLANQSLNRDDYEIILYDVFDTESRAAIQHADTVAVCGQNEHLYNRNEAFNFALAEARGEFVVYFDGNLQLPPHALSDIVSRLTEYEGSRTFLANVDHESGIHTLALPRQAAIDAYGLDESAYYAGAYSGPYELADRLKGQRWRVEEIVSAGKIAGKTRTGNLPALIRQIWPSKFSPYRVLPLRRNGGLAARSRQAL